MVIETHFVEKEGEITCIKMIIAELWAGMNNMLVKSKPLSKLCEYQGQELPDRYLSDCYGNVDETVWACKEKKRIMVSETLFFTSTISSETIMQTQLPTVAFSHLAIFTN